MIFSDVTLGGLSLVADPDAHGVKWRCPMSTISGWWGTPAPQKDIRPRPGAHGVWVGESWLPGRAVSLRGWCEADSRADVIAAVDRLNAAMGLGDVPLTIADSGTSHTVTVRRDGEFDPQWVHSRLAKWIVQVLAEDPRKLGAPLVVSTGLPSTSGGWTFPMTFPAPINATVVTGQAALTNPGNIAGPVMLRIDGPVVAPVVTHSSGLVWASSLSLAAGEFITVDAQRREVLAQGQASRNNSTTQRGYAAFEPGLNVWSFAATSGSGLLTVTATPAWY